MATVSLTPLPKISLYSLLSRRNAVRFSVPFTGAPNPLSVPNSVCRVPAMFSPRNALSSSNLPGLPASLLDLLHASPATWESSIASNILIFTIGSPLLLSGLSALGMGSAFLLGVLTWRAFEAPGFFLVATYFVVGTAVTKLKIAQKEALGVAEKRMGRRGPGSVIGSSAAGCVSALLSIYGVGGSAFSEVWRLAFVASFCTKLSDTVSSEIGKAYGKTAYLVTTFKVAPCGTEGAVSVEGTVAGLLASVLLSAVGYFMGEVLPRCLVGLPRRSKLFRIRVNAPQAAICVIASQIANIGESFIGAAFQEKDGFQWLNNDAVNVLNISIGSILAVLMQILLFDGWR